ncbi:MAG TPA: sensor histidine kinase [Chryseolinea sp.]|nr:sensor histidine kinase [Chryseolinea sp.]
MKFSLPVLFFSLSLPLVTYSQGAKDSLIHNIAVAKDDTAKVILLLKIADLYEMNQQDSAIYYLEQVKELAERLKFKRGLYKYYEQRSIVSFTTGNYTQSLEHNDNALAIAQELGDSTLLVSVLGNAGIIYQYLGKFDTQLEKSLQALAIMEKRGQKGRLSSMYHNIGNAYYNLKQFRKGVDYCLLSLKFDQQYGGNNYKNRVLASVAQGYNYLKMKDSALYFYKRAVSASEKQNDKYAIAAIYGYMADAYAESNEFVSMLEVSTKSLLLAKELQSRQLLASSLYTLGYAHYFNKEQAKSKIYTYEALKIAEEDSLNDELKNIYSVLSYVAAREEDFKTSLWAKAKSDSIRDGALNDEVLRTTTELQEKYEAEKRNNQIKLQQVELTQKNTLNYLLMVAIAAVLLVAFSLYRTYSHKQKLQRQRINELETEKKLMAAEAVLKGEEQERARLAKDLHDGLGGMLSGIKYSFNAMKGNLIMTPENHQAFERSMDMLDSSIKEMRRVAHNMMPETLVRFGLDTALRDYCNDINQSGALQVTYQSLGLENETFDPTTAITIYRIVQELVTNTMKHAAAKTSIVQLTKAKGELSITIEDDGKGFDTNILKQSKGIGWTNIQHRIEFLKGKLDVNSEPGKGTSVHIELNI